MPARLTLVLWLLLSRDHEHHATWCLALVREGAAADVATDVYRVTGN